VEEEFQHKEDVEEPFQEFIGWDSLLIYDTGVNDKDLVGSSLSYDQEN
jgi:hypothetical protein